MMRPWILLALASLRLGASTMDMAQDGPKAMAAKVAALARALASGKAVFLPLAAAAPETRWTGEGLELALGSQAPFKIGGDAPAPGYVKRASVSRLLLIENKSSVSPLSKQLPAWGWPFQAADFEQVEKAPKVWLDASTYDAVLFSSPGWWDNFSNPPSGPSRMTDA